MRVRTLEGWGWFVTLDVGEEIVASLTGLAARERIEGAQISGLGAVREVTLGFFDPVALEYMSRTFEEQMEIGNLVGNLGLLAGEPVLHAHMTVGGPDLAARTGHLFRGIVGVTAEILVTRLPCTLTRRPDEAVGLDLIDLDDGPSGEAEQ